VAGDLVGYYIKLPELLHYFQMLEIFGILSPIVTFFIL